METIKNERIRRWIFAGSWAGFIYATLPIAWPIFNFLKQYSWFPLSVNAVIVFLIILIVGPFLRTKLDHRVSTYFLLFLVLAGYGSGMTLLRLPVERLHLIEYGILAFLMHRALVLDLKGPWAYGAAFIATSLIGLGDEGIQYFLPNRYCQFQDVCLNSASAALGLLFVFALNRKPVSRVK